MPRGIDEGLPTTSTTEEKRPLHSIADENERMLSDVEVNDVKELIWFTRRMIVISPRLTGEERIKKLKYWDSKYPFCLEDNQ